MVDESFIKNYIRLNTLSFKKNFAPQGVIFISNKKALVGMHHGKLPLLSQDLLDRLLPISDVGLFYEGLKGGPDVKLTEPLFGKYDDGFDYVMQRSISGHPPEFLYALFSNNPPESISDYITDTLGKKTIFETMVSAGYKISALKKNKPDVKTVEKFLKSISNPIKKINFLEISQKTKATKSEVVKFLKLGNSEMWPNNWESYPNPAGRIAKKANDFRDIWVARKGPNGLYTIGSGHLLAIAKLSGKKIIDGRDIER